MGEIQSVRNLIPRNEIDIETGFKIGIVLKYNRGYYLVGNGRNNL